ncbi:hypothetical protein HHI36_011214 [Cryptolaemus montrouzieri]|uniref:Uncharacterized protein n=1 Tax=Cryptolaemus montrouzieri TaxID=559131 RepID=A0ABD2ML66_9CUCU
MAAFEMYLSRRFFLRIFKGTRFASAKMPGTGLLLKAPVISLAALLLMTSSPDLAPQHSFGNTDVPGGVAALLQNFIVCVWVDNLVCLNISCLEEVHPFS